MCHLLVLRLGCSVLSNFREGDPRKSSILKDVFYPKNLSEIIWARENIKIFFSQNCRQVKFDFNGTAFIEKTTKKLFKKYI